MKGGLWRGPDCRNSSRLFSFFSLAELKSPPCVWLEQKEECEPNRQKSSVAKQTEAAVLWAWAPLMMKQEVPRSAPTNHFFIRCPTQQGSVFSLETGARERGRRVKMGERQRHTQRERESGGWSWEWRMTQKSTPLALRRRTALSRHTGILYTLYLSYYIN